MIVLFCRYIILLYITFIMLSYRRFFLYRGSIGASASSACISCGVNTYRYFVVIHFNCFSSVCKHPFFSSASNATSAATCIACPTGYYSSSGE